MHIRKLAILLVLVAVGATACGSSSKGASSTTSSTAAGSTPTAGGGSTDSSSTPTTGKLSGDSGSNFCDLARSYVSKALDSSNIATGTPESLKQAYKDIGSELDQAKAVAPNELKADFDTFSTAIKQLADALAAANYDITKVAPSSLASLDTPALKAASDHVEQYVEQVCHVSPTSTP